MQEVEELTGQLRALEARVVEVARRGGTGKARAQKKLMLIRVCIHKYTNASLSLSCFLSSCIYIYTYVEIDTYDHKH